VARLVPLEGVKRDRPLGLDAGRFRVPEDFDERPKDPFDRLLVAQAQLEDCSLLSVDARFKAYDVRYLHAGR
jgi:PIN domain nuclease of toxin-antitoxin system